MYATTNFATKAQLKAAVKNRVGDLTIFAPGLGTPKSDGVEFLSGPHFPKPHTWHAKVQMKDGKIVKVLG
jgi:hypothetical protein